MKNKGKTFCCEITGFIHTKKKAASASSTQNYTINNPSLFIHTTQTPSIALHALDLVQLHLQIHPRRAHTQKLRRHVDHALLLRLALLLGLFQPFRHQLVLLAVQAIGRESCLC
eukprot:m.184941 g.184941  ORF g.184941 m.184941 type:complete len:114 (-) comp17494_c3_seq1:1234-1575(-)